MLWATVLPDESPQVADGERATVVCDEALLTTEAVAGRTAAGTSGAVDPALADLIQERGTRVRARNEEER